MATTESDLTAEAPSRDTGGEPARIQACGFLIVLDPDWRVLHVSENIGDHFADCGRTMSGQPLADFFGSAAVHSLRNQLALTRDPNGSARLFSLFFASVPKPFDVAMHRNGESILLEVLPAAHAEAGDPIGTARALFRQLDGEDDPATLLRHAAHQLRALTGFERVTIFRLDTGRGAEAVAHDSRGDIPPAGTCPDTGGRLIADADAACVALEPHADAGMLSEALLRSCTEQERDAVRAEGAAAALVTPLRSAGRNWGVAVCLNRTPRRLSLERLAAAELFAELLAMRFEICELRKS